MAAPALQRMRRAGLPGWLAYQRTSVLCRVLELARRYARLGGVR